VILICLDRVIISIFSGSISSGPEQLVRPVRQVPDHFQETLFHNLLFVSFASVKDKQYKADFNCGFILFGEDLLEFLPN